MVHRVRKTAVLICLLFGWTNLVASQSLKALNGHYRSPGWVLGLQLVDGSGGGIVTEKNAPRLSASQQRSSGSINGTVLDQSGAVMVGARVRLATNGSDKEVHSGNNGQFSFADIAPGPFQLTITSAGFSSHVFSGALEAGQSYLVPPIVLTVTRNRTEVWVKIRSADVAAAQIQEQEKQRVLGVIPNFYVSYIHEAVPMSSKQKFQLAWKSTTDPFTAVGVGILAGAQQAADALEGYGQGAQGYAKRFAASYADVATGTFIGSAVLPSLLKQDPRYFYKGTGSVPSRLLYSMASPVFCKGDNRRWQPNYSNVLGAFASGGISYLYYPPSDRRGIGLLLTNTAIRLAETSFEGVLQEFLIPHLTPRFRKRAKQNAVKVSNPPATHP
jgi:carboxypeptidase family protein